MKIQATLQPKNYAIEYLSVESNPSFHPTDKKTKMEMGFGVAPRLRQRKGTGEYLLQIEVRVNESPKAFKRSPYRVILRLATFLEVERDLPKDQREKMLWLNGLAIAYGIARGVVAQVTAQGPYPKFVLPAMNFVEFLKQIKKKKS